MLNQVKYMSINEDNMNESLTCSIHGHITIADKHTGEVLVDKPNAVHYGNISTELAQAFIGTSDSFITYMAFGNGGVIIDSAGNIIYRNPNTSLNKNENDQLYNTTLVVELTNNASTGVSDPDVTIPGGNTQNFEDIVATVVLSSGFPSSEQVMDNAGGISNQNADDSTTTFVFNELALYTGQKDKGNKQTYNDIQTFLNEEDTVLVTHVIFHPVQKASNRTLEITYTLRIQMGN